MPRVWAHAGPPPGVSHMASTLTHFFCICLAQRLWPCMAQGPAWPGSGLTPAHHLGSRRSTTWVFSYGMHCDTVSWPCLAHALDSRSSTSCGFSGFYCGTFFWAGLAQGLSYGLWPCLAQGLGSRWSTTGGFSYGFHCDIASVALSWPGLGTRWSLFVWHPL